MIEPKLFQEIFDKFYENIPSALKNNLDLAPFKEDLAKSFKLVLEQSFNKLNLVTREQFDIQSKVLATTRQQLDLLSKKVTELEKNLNK